MATTTTKTTLTTRQRRFDTKRRAKWLFYGLAGRAKCNKMTSIPHIITLTG